MRNRYRPDVASFLASKATQGQLVTYSELSEEFGGTARNWGGVLGGIVVRCSGANVPLLPVIVVRKDTARPSDDAALYPEFGIETREQMFAEQQRCFQFNWSTTPRLRGER